ncbi:MAG: TRAP transporter substrate-binding protein [Spirochaetes bacterium]|nr:TRAP transporter substrate-binding protein [Spirochaetota bacterium]
MRKLAISLLLIAVVAGLVFSEGKKENIVLRLGHIRDTNNPTHLAAVRFQELVEKNSGGRITVKVFPNSQLGTPNEMFAQMQSGDLEMAYGGIQTFTFIKGGELFEITAMPFLFSSYGQIRKVLNSNFLKPHIEKVENQTKIKIVNMNGMKDPRGLTTKGRAVNSLADLKGLKVRVAQSELNLKVWKALGTMPQVIAYSDLYMALKTGMVDAQENGSVTVKSASFFEVQDYYIKTDYSRDVETFYMALDFWNKLSKADQNLIYKATEQAGNYETELMEKQLADVYTFLKTKMTVIENPDGASMRKAIEDSGIFTERAAAWPPGMLDYIKSVK